MVSLLSFLEYITPDIAFAVSTSHPDEARRKAARGVWLSCGIGVPAAAALAVAARPRAGCSAAVARCCAARHRVPVDQRRRLPFVLLAFLGHGVLRGHNDMRTPLRIVIVANIANLLLEIVAVYWLHLSVAGSAWSTVIIRRRGGSIPVAHAAPPAARAAVVGQLSAAARRRQSHGPAVDGDLQRVGTTTIIAAHLDSPTLAANQVVTQLFMFLALLLDALAIRALTSSGAAGHRQR